MIPLLATEQMRAADAAAVARRGTDALVHAAGTAVALEAQRMLGSCYGRRVAVVAGPGLNGADGRVAAEWLRGRGARVDVIDALAAPRELRGFALVIDAAFGLGCSRPYVGPVIEERTLVLAVDLPSGVDADTGAVLGAPARADVTVALGAVKPAHLTGAAAHLVGDLRFAGLGIVERFEDGVMEDADLEGLVTRRTDDHKWNYAVQVLAGSPLMPGAAELVTRGALVGGASMIRLASRGEIGGLTRLAPEVVRVVDDEIDPRCRMVIAGPGLGRDAQPWLRERLGGVAAPVVLDADGLDRSLIDDVAPRDGRWVLTPHAGEFAKLVGSPVPDDRLAATRDLARATGCVVLLKGPVTVLAGPDGTVRVVRSGTTALATAGSGDVLAGLIGATIARGRDPLDAAALAAHLHGRAGARLGVYAPASAIADAAGQILNSLAS